MKNAIRYCLFICLNLSIYSICYSQKTIITGRITDNSTLEGVAFANVYFKSTTIGTTSDFDGFYELVSDTPLDSLTVSFIGYNSESKAISKGIKQEVNFALTPSMIGLAEVIITPGENPAVTLLKKVWANKPTHNIDALEGYEFQSYVKTQVYLRRLLNPKKPKDTSSKGIFNRFSLTSDENTAPALPVYVSEVASHVFNLKFPEREKVVVKATQTNSLADIETNMLTQLIQKNTAYNFNNNFVQILDKNFVSPTSTAGLFYYKYYLTDSLFIDNRYCYEIRFVPRREADLVFSGNMWINDTSFALKRISVEVGKNANLNFVERIQIQQDLNQTIYGAWYPERTRILADAINIYISALIYNHDFKADMSYPLSFFDKELAISDTAENENIETWAHYKSLTKETNESAFIASIDSLKNIGKVKFLTALVNMSIKGYVNLGKIELGPYLMVYKKNPIEGHRFRLGYRTNSALSTKWISKGYLAYGTLDNTFKYNAQLERFLSRKTWTKVGIQYMEDVENLGAMDEFYSQSAFLSFASSFGGTDKLNSIKVGRLWFETDLFRGFTQKIVFKNKYYTPLSPDYFFEYYTDITNNIRKKDLNVSEITLTSIYQPKATFIIDKNERFPVSIKKAPTFTLNYTKGLKNVLNGDFDYHKASLSIAQSMRWGSVGVFSYDLNLSKCFTPLPYPLLTLFPANESFFRAEKTFNLMTYGEFIADESVELFCTYRQDGFIFDKLPLIKKLRLRSVATFSLAYGSFDKRNGINNSENPSGIIPEFDSQGNPITYFKTLDANKPYIEVSYGIENIFRVFRIDAVHRLSYLESNNGNTPQKFGLKIGAVFRF